MVSATFGPKKESSANKSILCQWTIVPPQSFPLMSYPHLLLSEDTIETSSTSHQGIHCCEANLSTAFNLATAQPTWHPEKCFLYVSNQMNGSIMLGGGGGAAQHWHSLCEESAEDWPFWGDMQTVELSPDDNSKGLKAKLDP